MSHDLNADARLQNALMLARLLGDEALDRAYELLDVQVEVRADLTNACTKVFADDLAALLARTVSRVSTAESPCGIEVWAPEGRICRVWADPAGVTVSSQDGECPPFRHFDTAFRVAAACYACAFVVARLVRDKSMETPDPLVIARDSLPQIDEAMAVDFGSSWLIGAGAVGCGFLWALRALRLDGVLNIVDPKRVTAGNLNRQILFGESDVESPKAIAAADHAARILQGLQLLPYVGTFQAAFDGKSPERVIVGLDTREARQELQLELPREVFDASTTGAVEVLFHRNTRGGGRACLGCVYPSRSDALDHARHVAEGLGLDVEDVIAPFISRDVALKIEKNFPQFTASAIEGRAIDSLYREACGAAVLLSPTGERVLAPFAFVSVLAGTLLAMHVIAELQGARFDYNLWPISPYRPPFEQAQEDMPQRPGCACQSGEFRTAAAILS